LRPRYVLATSTVPAEKVRVQLDRISNTVPTYRAIAWSKGDLARFLDEHPGVRGRYFPPQLVPAPTPAGALADTVKRLLKAMGFACRSREVTPDRGWIVYTHKSAFPHPMAIVCKEGTVEHPDVEALFTEVEAQELGGGIVVAHTRVSSEARKRAAETGGTVQVFTLDELYRFPLLLLELFHLVGVHIEARMAVGVGGKVGFEAQMLQELVGVRQFFPHLGEEGGPTPAALDDHAIHAWAQPGDEIVRAVVR
jgi:hypothetical protein